jgi:N-acetylglucosamine kinase-like BadF-type ATPase|tara:strand:- start:13178 stop:14017 length:840 start_codon:yes stop_codon:yes gene_type:complete
MQLIIESGSTKADWVIFSTRENAHTYSTHGINPTTLTDLSVIKLPSDLIKQLEYVTKIHYYGAGINSMQAVERIKSWLKSYSPKAKEIDVAEDCLAAARACFGNTEGIIGILGTGSNSSYYDGNQVYNLVPTLGFIISDEGGGVYLGKEILRSYFYGYMPEDVRMIFEDKYLTDKTEILYKLYRGGEPNRFLASYASLLTDVHTEWTDTLVLTCIRRYLEVRIIPFYDNRQLTLCFVGSIAHYHKHILAELCEEYNISLGKIIHKPLESLMNYHLTLLD